MEMGLLEGEEVEVVGFAPMGDPMEVRLGDYRLSLRRIEAARVHVEPYDLTRLPTTGKGMPGTMPPLLHRPTAALVGNPNTGKTTLFNALSGLRQRVGNYPGVTVETKKGQMTCWRTVIRRNRPARHLQPGAAQPRRDGGR